MECTVNRAGDEFIEQLERTGHAQRVADLDLVAELGVSALRYPVLWERSAPHRLANADWDSYTDVLAARASMERAKVLRVPIALITCSRVN